jgi:hypothetical protein
MSKRCLKRMMMSCKLKREKRFDCPNGSRCWSIYTDDVHGNQFVMLFWSDDLIREEAE